MKLPCYFNHKEIEAFEKAHPHLERVHLLEHPKEQRLNTAYVLAIAALMMVFFFSKLPLIFLVILGMVVFLKLFFPIIRVHQEMLPLRPHDFKLIVGDVLIVLNKNHERELSQMEVKVVDISDKGITLDNPRWGHSLELSWENFKIWLCPHKFISGILEDQLVYRIIKA